MSTAFDALDWSDGHLCVAGYTFRLQHGVPETTADDAFLFYKQRTQVEQFFRFLDETGFAPRRVLELGIWDGGSAAFWTETLGLERYSALDLQERGDSSYFRRWVEERAAGRVATHWGVDQTDATALTAILDRDGLDPLDLVLDDCSHLYAPTLASFEILFPRLRPGGWYVIEDWAWALQAPFQDRDHPWGVNRALHPIVHRLLDLHGSRPDLVPSIRVFPDFVALERGPADVCELSVTDSIARRDRPWGKVALSRTRGRAGRVRRGLAASR